MKKLLALLALAGSLSTGIAVMAQGQPLTFEGWASAHEKWCHQHPDRVHYFRSNPAAAEAFLHQSEVSDAKRYNYLEWAAEHPGWVNEHRDRAEYFKAHPTEAEKYRKEWAEQKESQAQSKAWINQWEQKWKHGSH